MTSLIVASFLGTAVFAVLTAAGLQFVGLGNPNSLSWGNMLYWAQNNEALDAGMPLWAIVPGVCIALLGGAFAFLNYAFDEISNPALRPVRRLSHRRSATRQHCSPGAGDWRHGGCADLERPRRAAIAGPDRWQDGRITPPATTAGAAGATAGPALTNETTPGPLLEVRDLSVAYATDAGPVHRRRRRRPRPRQRGVPRRRRRVRLREVDAHVRHRATAEPAGPYNGREGRLPRPARWPR